MLAMAKAISVVGETVHLVSEMLVVDAAQRYAKVRADAVVSSCLIY